MIESRDLAVSTTLDWSRYIRRRIPIDKMLLNTYPLQGNDIVLTYLLSYIPHLIPQ